MKEIDVKPTVEVIRLAILHMEATIASLECIAIKIEETKDLSYAGAALGAIINCIAASRLELLSVRPIRELEHARRSDCTVMPDTMTKEFIEKVMGSALAEQVTKDVKKIDS